MNPDDIRAYSRRWKMVAERERRELRSTPPERKLEQLAALMNTARKLDWQTTDPREVAAVRERWKRLQVLCGV
ncbi:MAG: hypothetical protein O7J95_15580 [Planctomycetota bacterium]|nr:hypothetical protein [Planctomycetota bacterium]